VEPHANSRGTNIGPNRAPVHATRAGQDAKIPVRSRRGAPRSSDRGGTNRDAAPNVANVPIRAAGLETTTRPIVRRATGTHRSVIATSANRRGLVAKLHRASDPSSDPSNVRPTATIRDVTPDRRANVKSAILVTNPRAAPMNRAIGTTPRHATTAFPRASVRAPATSDPLGLRATTVAIRAMNRDAKCGASPVATALLRAVLTTATTFRETGREANRDVTTPHGAEPEAHLDTSRDANRDARMARATEHEATRGGTTPRGVAHEAPFDPSDATTPRATGRERVRETHRDATTPRETGRGEIRDRARRTRNADLRRGASRVAALLAVATAIAAMRVAIRMPENAAIRG